MSVLASLVRAYERMGSDGPAFGYARLDVSFSIRIDRNGKPVCPPIDLRNPSGRGQKLIGRRLELPTFLGQRTSGIDPNFLWDKTPYSLGVAKFDPKTAPRKQTKDAARVIEMHAAFVKLHRQYLSLSADEGLIALLRFLETWTPDQFDSWPEEMKGENVVFEFDGDCGRFMHERQEAREIWSKVLTDQPAPEAACLVYGTRSRTLLSHPPIKGVVDAQSSGAFIVSFNLDSFTSYGHEQGDNAPVSEDAAFKYTTALNRFLERDSGHRIQIGDASTVFWADASDAGEAKEAEDIFAALNRVDEKAESKKVATILEAVRQGRPIADLKPGLPQGVRFYVLGLSPNTSRLSVRFFIEDDFREIATRYLAHIARMGIEPPLKEDAAASIWRLLIETAAQHRSENIPPNLAGEWLRAILTGSYYPLTLLSTLLMRLRADHDVNALRVGMMKAVLIRNFEMEAPVSLDPENNDPGYLLGRLFATYEYTQSQALGGNVNATIRDQYYGTASATPRAVFPLLQRKTTHHLSRLRKDKPGLATNLDRRIGEIFELAEPESLFVPTLSAQRQALFAVGYYHQRNDFYRRKGGARGEPANQE
jgi:CRISPR-associated protein Csd1